MGLLSETVEISLNSRNIKYYEGLGYKIPKRKDKRGILTTPRGTNIIINIKDLSNGSNVRIDVECDNCRTELKSIIWQDYLKCVHEDGKYYCNKCANKLYGKSKEIQSRIKNKGSFEDWCKQNNYQSILERWDYKLNDCKPSEITYKTGIKYYFKCPRNLHKSELKRISDFTSKKQNSMDCKCCNSFAQWGIDNLGDGFLEKYWDYEKNNDLGINPWEINKGTNCLKVWIKCQNINKLYHGSYDVDPNSFIIGSGCPYCSNKNGKVHLLDSLGTLFPQVLEIWSDRNDKSAYEYSPMSHQDVYWKCPDEKHEDYNRNILNSNTHNFRCPECVQEKNMSFLQEKVQLYLNELKYTILHEYKCTIIPINPKTKYKLPFDNEIKELKLIIEVHGLQHYKISSWHKELAKKNNTTPEQELHYQKLKDRYKRIFAKRQGYFYLEISYLTDDKEETWKKLIDDKIKEVNNI